MKSKFNITSGLEKNLSHPFKVVASAIRALRTIFATAPQDDAHLQAKSLMTGCFDATPNVNTPDEESDTGGKKRSPKPFHAPNRLLRPQ